MNLEALGAVFWVLEDEQVESGGTSTRKAAGRRSGSWTR